MRFEGKVAIVTGSGQGIGAEIARRFAAEGASVVVSDIDGKKADRVAAKIKGNGGKAIAIKADVTSKAEVEILVKKTLDSFKSIHILVNNAGILLNAPLLEMKEKEWDAVLAVDLKGVYLCTQAVLGHMMRQRYGKIINISSAAALGTSNTEAMTNYVAAKAGVIGLTKVTARIAGPSGVNVNCIAPGMILTDIVNTLGPGGGPLSKEALANFLEPRKKLALLGRLGEPKDIANVALFLASEDSSFMTGQLLSVDGGRSDHL